MMKRALSILLCLIMVLGLAVPSVQATTEVTTSTNIMDNISIDGDFSGNIVIDGNTVTSSGETKLPYPTDLLEQEDPSYTFGAAVPETSAPAYECKCADLSTAVEHVGICDIKRPYIEQCEASEEELFALWGSYTLVEQDFMLSYLSENYPVKYAELAKLLRAPTGSASETYTDGTTVSVQGIPQDGSLSVVEASGEVQDIVDAYVADKSGNPTELFSYDVSVQDAEGADWQPETNVKVELDLPGQKLHKYTQVYVVHVDDEGNATTIEATVTEDGKIAFETPGFSTFAGFIVEFDYEGAGFAIPGLSSIKLSEVFDNLRMPLNVEDVVNVEYTDDTQIKVEKLEGDWLLTSLQAFTTEEKLTITMSDGAVYNIRVTDDLTGNKADCYMTYQENNNKACWLENASAGKGNGIITIKLDSDGIPGKNGESSSDDDGTNDNSDSDYLNKYWRDQPVVIDGRNIGGAFEIILDKHPNETGTDLKLYLYQIRIINGAKVNIRLGPNITSEDSIRILTYAGGTMYNQPMFFIEDGSLFFNLKSDEADLLPAGHNFTVSSLNKKITVNRNARGTSTEQPIIYMGVGSLTKDSAGNITDDSTKEELVFSNADFWYSGYRALYCKTDCSARIRFNSCYFDDTVNCAGDGGAILVEQLTRVTAGAQVNINIFELIGCTFDGNYADTKNADGNFQNGEYYGGAVCLYGNMDNTYINSTTRFLNCHAGWQGGAINIGKGQVDDFNTGSFYFDGCEFNGCNTGRYYGGAITVKDKFEQLDFDNCRFLNNTAKSHAGAINVSHDDNPITGKDVNFENCTFTNNTATGNRAGAVRIVLKKYSDTVSPSISMDNCHFTNHSAGSLGGTISISAMDTEGQTGATIASVSITNSSINGSVAGNAGGGAYISDGTYGSITIQNTSFTGCESPRYGGALCMRTQSTGRDFKVLGNISVIGCDFSKCHAGYLSCDTFANNDKTHKNPLMWDHDNNPYTPDIQQINGIGGGGAIAFGGVVDGSVIIMGASENDKTLMQNCTSWNNGGAIDFTNDMVINGNNPDDPDAPAVTLKFLDMDKCFARDAGFAIYLGQVVVPSLVMEKCDTQNCGFFDLTNPDFPREQVFPEITGTSEANKLADKWFITPTIYKQENGEWVKDTDEVNKQYDEFYLSTWKSYTQEDLCVSFDTGGTFRTIGYCFCIAEITDCRFLNNSSFSNGAGVYWNALEVHEGNLPQLTLKNTIFDGNYAHLNGGAIYCEATVTILSCEFMNNEAKNNGGAIAQQVYNNEGRHIDVDEVNKIILGTAEGVEGQTYNPTSFHHNKAYNGGAVAITVAKTKSVTEGNLRHYPIEFTLGGSHVYNNVATANGGGIYYATYTYSADADQKEVDYFQKKVDINNGLIYGNVAGATASLVADGYTPQAGDQLVIVAVDKNVAMSTTQNGDYRGEATVNMFTPQQTVTFDDKTQILTLRQGKQTGTYAFQIAGDVYLGANGSDDYELSRVSYSHDSNAWQITIDPNTGVATIIVKPYNSITDRRSVMRYNHSGPWFNTYTPKNAASTSCYDLAIYRVVEEGFGKGKAMLVTDLNSLKLGERFIIVAPEHGVTISTRYNSAETYRIPVTVSTPTYQNVAFGADTNVMTLVPGKADGTYGLQLANGNYLRTSSTTDGNRLLENSTLDLAGSWTFTIDPSTGAARVTSKETTSGRNTIYYNNNGGKGGWFNNYEFQQQETTNLKFISVYRVNSKDDTYRTATLITDESLLREGDRIIIVARNYNFALGDHKEGDYIRVTANVTKQNSLSFGSDTEVVTLVPGSKSGTFAMQTRDGKYLAATGSVGKEKVGTIDVINDSSSWTISVSGGKLTAKATNVNNFFLRYDAVNGGFCCYGTEASQKDLMLYRLGAESGGGNGGGIYMNSNQINTGTDTGYSQVTISGGSIYDNTAYIGNGGGVYLTGKNALCTINGETTTIGAEYLGMTDDGKVNLSVDGGNSVSGTSQQSAGNGGGIAILGGARIEMTGGYVVNNKSTVAGGGIAVHGGSSMYFSDGTVEGNSSHIGGGISLNDAKAVVQNPTAATPDKDRYGMFLDGGNVKNNKVTPNADGVAYGGGICVSAQSTMKINGGVVFGNTAAYDLEATSFSTSHQGGGIAVCQSSSMVIAGGSIDSNKAGAGGGIVVRGGSELTMTGSVSVAEDGTVTHNGAIMNNRAYRYGGGVYLADGSVSNRMTIEGGYIYNNAAAVAETETGMTFDGNCLGGGVLVDENAYITISGGLIDSNRAHNGGGIYAWKGHVAVNEGVMSNNKAQRHGGAVYNDYSDITITGGEFTNNKANPDNVDSTDLGRGGAIFNYGVSGSPYEITISNGVFSGNTATLYGGAVCSENVGHTTITGGTFTGNQAANTISLEASGGALCIIKGTALISGGNFEKNSAKNYGGGAYFENSADIDFTTGTFIENSAQNGGGMCINGSTVEFTGGQFKNNVANNGGALYINSSTVNIKNIAANNNQAFENGGGAWIGTNATMTITGGSFNENMAAGNGGGVYVENQATAKILATSTGRGEINSNTACNGGGVYVTNGAKLEVHEGHITNNNAVASTMPNLNTAYEQDANLAGVGGGVCVTAGTSSAKSSFTLTGTVHSDNRMDVAIYGNSATFAADDVFASGNNTKLSVPKVEQMNLADYNFKPEAWTEDYVTNDAKYSSGTKMLSDAEITSLGISRYRNAGPDARKEMLISGDIITSVVNQENKYVCMTLGIPGATKDTVIVDYDTKVNINVSRNDLFITDTSYNSGNSYIGETFPEGAQHKDGIACSTGELPLANTVKNQAGEDIPDRYPDTFTSQKGVVTNNYNGTIAFKSNNTDIGTGYSFYYTVEREGFWYYAEVNVIPATSVYFEDNNTSIKYHENGDSELETLANWKPMGTALTEGQLRFPTADQIYGYDSAFSATTDYSGGTAHKVTATRHRGVDENNDSKCDECGVAIQLTHEYVSKNVTGQCKICLNQPEQHGDNVPEHTCIESSTYNEYCDLCGKWIGTHTTNARATFTFTGTGFDVVSLCNAQTGIVMVTVFKGVVENWDNPNWDNYITSYMVDTYYGYNYEEGKWVQNQDSSTSLYQVPVIQADLSRIMMVADDPATTGVDESEYKNYGYGTYSVEIYIAPSFLEREHGYWSTEFYLDGIRIYNPAGDGTGIYVTDEPVRDENGNIVYDEYFQPVYKEIEIDNSSIMDQYKEDGEGWPVYQELRNLLIAQKHNLKDESGNGVVFIDGNMGEPKLDDYIGYGPNNEVYLTPGKSLAFRLDALNYTNKLEEATHQDFDGSVIQSIHLGIRGLTGEGKVAIYSSGSSLAAYLGTTDMYYDITDMANKVVTITNTGSTPISISNIKITHKVNPYGVEGTGSGTWSGRDLITISQGDAQIALDILTPEELTDPVLQPKYPALSFEGMVCYNVFFTAEQLGDLNGADLGLAVFDRYDPEGTVETAKDVILGATQIDGLYMVATNGVHAKYLGDTQYFRAFAKKADGTYVYSKMVSYSALDYAKNTLAKSSDVKLKQLVVAMLNYGAEAQKFFGYNTENLMNKDLTAEQQALVSGFNAASLDAVEKADASKIGAFGSTGGFAKKYPAISFKGAFEINYFMAPSNAVDGEMTLYCWSEDTYISTTELTAENADKVVTMTLENGMYTASSFEIAAKDLDETVYVAAVYESNGQLYCSGVLPYSIAAYCQKPAAEVASLANAAAVYGCAAKEFFGA